MHENECLRVLLSLEEIGGNGMGLMECIRKYPIGTLVKLPEDDNEDYESHRVIGYKVICGINYLILDNDSICCENRVG